MILIDHIEIKVNLSSTTCILKSIIIYILEFSLKYTIVGLKLLYCHISKNFLFDKSNMLKSYKAEILMIKNETRRVIYMICFASRNRNVALAATLGTDERLEHDA